MSARLEAKAARDDVDMVTTLDVGPGGFDRFLDMVGDRPTSLIKSREGSLTLVSWSQRHACGADRLDDLIKAVCDGLEIDSRATASTLFRRPGVDHGIEADKTYYLAHEPAVRGVEVDIDLTVYPPPDLAVEVVVTHDPSKSLAVCQELGVPEVWVYRVKQRSLDFLVLDAHSRHLLEPSSRAFPFLRPADILPWVESPADEPDRLWRGRLRAWVRDVLAPKRT